MVEIDANNNNWPQYNIDKPNLYLTNMSKNSQVILNNQQNTENQIQTLKNVNMGVNSLPTQAYQGVIKLLHLQPITNGRKRSFPLDVANLPTQSFSGNVKLYREPPTITPKQSKNSKPCNHICQYVYTAADEAKHREKSNHSSICYVIAGQKCGKAFAEKRYLKTHEETHKSKNEKKLHVCNHPGCEAVLSSKRNLDQHKASQHPTAENPKPTYVCDFSDGRGGTCGKSYSSDSELKKHQNKHTPGACWKCFGCKSDFPSYSNYKKHLLKKIQKCTLVDREKVKEMLLAEPNCFKDTEKNQKTSILPLKNPPIVKFENKPHFRTPELPSLVPNRVKTNHYPPIVNKLKTERSPTKIDSSQEILPTYKYEQFPVLIQEINNEPMLPVTSNILPTIPFDRPIEMLPESLDQVPNTFQYEGPIELIH